MNILAACVMDGKAFEIDKKWYDRAIAAAVDGAVPALVCSKMCAEEYDINCLDWPEAKRNEMGIKPY